MWLTSDVCIIDTFDNDAIFEGSISVEVEIIKERSAHIRHVVSVCLK